MNFNEILFNVNRSHKKVAKTINGLNAFSKKIIKKVFFRMRQASSRLVLEKLIFHFLLALLWPFKIDFESPPLLSSYLS